MGSCLESRHLHLYYNSCSWRRDAGTEVGVTSVLTWLTLLSQLHVAGKDLEDETISIVTGMGLWAA